MRNKFLCAALLMTVIFSAGEAFGGGQTVKQYLSWSTDSRAAYMIGLVDAFHHLVFFPPSVDNSLADIGFSNYSECFQGKSYKQIRTIIERYVKSRRGLGNELVSSIFMPAMEEECKKNGFETKKDLW